LVLKKGLSFLQSQVGSIINFEFFFAQLQTESLGFGLETFESNMAGAYAWMA
jgi:hypothetical protein